MKHGFPRRRVLVGVALAALCLTPFVLLNNRSISFVYRWARLFRQCDTIADVAQIDQRFRPDLCVWRKFDNDEWVVGRMEHECCGGAGYNAIVFYDSSGRVFYNSEECICGYESFCPLVHNVEAKTLSEFYSGLGFRVVRWWL